MIFNTEFDRVISIDEDCACAMYLKELFLRDASYPFDWLCNATFEKKKKIELILDGFDGFLIKENMRCFPKPLVGLRDEKKKKKNDYYEDTNNGFHFLHDFKVNCSLDETFCDVRKKYDRRIERLYNSIIDNNRVLLVWWSRDKKLEGIREKQISEHIMKFSADLLKGLKTTQGDKKTTLKILRKVKKKNIGYIRVKSRFKKILANILASLVPVQSIRKSIRKHINNDD